MGATVDPIASSIAALSQQYESITSNLANASTPAYKRRCTAFSQTLLSKLRTPDAPVPPTGEVVGTQAIDFSQGHIIATGRALDVAIDGKGFMVVETPQGPLYTRNGTFRCDAQGMLVDHAGRPVAGEGGPIVLPAGTSSAQVTISDDGAVIAGGGEVGKLKLVEFDDTSRLAPVGGSCYAAPADATPNAAVASRVQGGAQEASNVSVVEELTAMITVSRLYEANFKMIRTQDEQARNLLQVAMG
jgi:flagellar basal-body rod protein FlgF